MPYLKAGGGGTFLSFPTVTVLQGTTNIKNETETVGLFLAEAGLQFRIISRYSFLLGLEQDWLGKSTLLGVLPGDDDEYIGVVQNPMVTYAKIK